MRIATWNIDWGRKYRSKTHYLNIESFLKEWDFDVLILTEAIQLHLPNYQYRYFSKEIPENVEFAGVNYTHYLRGEQAYRVAIYSKFPAVSFPAVKDEFTSLATEIKINKADWGEIETGFLDEPQGQSIIVYGSIIGTRFRKLPYAKVELENFLIDCDYLIRQNPNTIIAGDLNTSFLNLEKEYSINQNTTHRIKSKILEMNMLIATENLKSNIDHIIVPNIPESRVVNSEIFIERGVLSDHQGVWVEFDI